ncbi:MAG TPA: DUF2127 domain-containing protein [Dongiaceae bacterium]|jgi:uncharacterized membrane protein (DUF2068 family)|nr:DUF2127 domain-containing protein [Dongiaceae bacterium]
MPAPAPTAKKHAPTLYFIVAIKLVKGALLVLLALGFFTLANRDLASGFDSLLRWVHLDPENKFFGAIGDRLETITPANVRHVASGAFLFGAFLLVSGSGLLFRVSWAIWLAIGESAFFIPIEVFELLRRPSWALSCVLVVNLIIVCYLYFNRNRLFRHHH